MAGLDPRFITTNTLEPYFVDRNSGLPLANGQIQFWTDNSRTVPKTVYQLTGDPGNDGQDYSYVPLPNPITLSATGTIEDNDGNNVALYYFPYDGNADTSTGLTELYYIVVLDQYGNVQFTRQAWPNTESVDQNEEFVGTGVDNQITNPQFALSYDQGSGISIPFSGTAPVSYLIAPGWNINFTPNGSGTLLITLLPQQGSYDIPTNPPYVLYVQPNASISAISLVQTFVADPAVWTAQNGEIGGYLAGGLLLANSYAATMTYQPIPATTTPLNGTQILSVNNASGGYKYYTGTVQLPVSTNPNTPVNGGASSLVISWNPAVGIQLSSIQLLPLQYNTQIVPYLEDSVNRQLDHTFNFYRSLLAQKPISSYLIGWDFPLNPASIYGDASSTSMTGTGNTYVAGTNVSYYIWDQTIIYQSATNSLNFARASDGSLKITAIANTQFALIQYLPQKEARDILANPEFSLNIEAATNQSAGIAGNFSVYTTSLTGAGVLPNIGTIQPVTPGSSIVASLNADGSVNTTNPASGTWTKIPRTIMGTAANFTLSSNTYTSIGRRGFFGGSYSTSSTYIAVIVGFGTLTAGNYVQINSISLVPGGIPTIPATEKYDAVKRSCQRFYQQTYLTSADRYSSGPVNNGAQSGAFNAIVQSSGSSTYLYPSEFEINFYPSMITAPTLSIYSPVNNSSSNIAYYYKLTTGAYTSGTTYALTNYTNSANGSATLSSANALYVSNTDTPVIVTGQVINSYIGFHYVANALLGTF